MATSPIPNSYWLIDEQLLAGEYPGSYDDDEARRKLEAILAAGIRSFVDLTETTDPLEPYEPILRDLAASVGLVVRYQRFAIRDMSVPTREVMETIVATIEAELAAGRPVYFHCWGGIGRTGTVAACWLVGQGQSCDEALERLKELRAPTPNGRIESPQTEVQMAFVRSWRRD